MESLLELNDHLSQLEETFEKQRVVQTQLQFQGEDLQRKITIKVADNKLLEVKKHHQDMQIKELRKELEHLQDTLPGYELDEKALKSELDLISKEKSNYIESENEIKLQLNESVKVIKNIKEHNRSLRQKVSEIEIDINDDIYKIVNITEKHENLMHQYYRELEESRAITEKLESLKRNVMDIQDTERRQAYELNDIEQKLTENQAKIEALKLGKIKYIDIKNHLKSQIQSAERDFKDIQSEEDSLNGLISESNSKCHDLEMKLSKKIKNDSSAFLIDINFLDNKISETER